MAFSESLSTYLMGRQDKRASFFIGHWLRALDDCKLNHLRALAKEFQEGKGDPHLDDVLAICLIAYCAETRKQDCQVTESLVNDWSDILVAAVNIEGYRRKGWLTCIDPLSIRSNINVAFDMTPSGMAHFANMEVSNE